MSVNCIYILDTNYNFCSVLKQKLNRQLKFRVSPYFSLNEFLKLDLTQINILIIDSFMAYKKVGNKFLFSVIKETNQNVKLFIVNTGQLIKNPIKTADSDEIPVFGKTLLAMDLLVNEINYGISRNQNNLE